MKAVVQTNQFHGTWTGRDGGVNYENYITFAGNPTTYSVSVKTKGKAESDFPVGQEVEYESNGNTPEGVPKVKIPFSRGQHPSGGSRGGSHGGSSKGYDNLGQQVGACIHDAVALVSSGKVACDPADPLKTVYALTLRLVKMGDAIKAAVSTSQPPPPAPVPAPAPSAPVEQPDDTPYDDEPMPF